MPRMTDEEVMRHLREDTQLGRARRILSSHCGKIEQASQQRVGLSPVEWRRMELEAVLDIADELGVESLRREVENHD